jgi:hypothetical protein
MKNTSYSIENMYLLYIFPFISTHLRLRCSNFFNPSKKNSFGCAANRRMGNRKSQRLIRTHMYGAFGTALLPVNEMQRKQSPNTFVRFEVLRAVTLNSIIFQGVAQYIQVESNDVSEVLPPEERMDFYRITWHYFPLQSLLFIIICLNNGPAVDIGSDIS